MGFWRCQWFQRFQGFQPQLSTSAGALCLAVAVAACSHESPAAPSAPAAATAAACTYLVSPTTIQIPSAGGTFQASVNSGAASGCQWTASTSNTWMRLAVTTNSQGTGAVAMTVDPILTMPTRHGAVTVSWTGGSQVINVDQASAPYAVRGFVTDAVRHAGIAGARVELQTAPNAYFAATAVTDNTGAYAIPGLAGGTYRVRASAAGYDPVERVVDVIQADLRVDFELRPPVAPAANYAGVWTGVYDVTDCRDIDIPGFTQFHLCGMRRPQSYQFTLIQTGTLVTGSYKLVTSFYSCPCQLDGGYGEIPMAGSISPDGTLAITALGNTRGLVGATAELDLLLRQPSPSTITGAGTIHLRFGTPDDRSIGSVVIRSGTRTQ